MSEELLNKCLDRVYSEMVNTVLEEFDSSEIDQVKKYYKEYVNNTYKEIISAEKEDIEKIIKVCLIMEQSVWNDQSKEYKLSMLVKDEYLDQLGTLSQKAFNLALERKESGRITIDKEEAKQNIEKMNELYKKVQPFNSVIAFSYLSEGTLDFNYSCGNHDECSLRIGRAL